MIKLKLQYQFLLFFFIITIHFISSQICRNNISDLFYNVDFAGPIFDQSVYYIPSNFSVSTPNQTTVFTFTVKPQKDYTRPSFISRTVSDCSLTNAQDNIIVTSDDPSFTVSYNPTNCFYALVTNTFPLNYFLPFNRYLFKLIAKQDFSDQLERPPVISTAIVQINLENANVHDPYFIPDNQIFYISELAQPDTEFGTVYATDPDNDMIIYKIINNTQFSIDPQRGVLRLHRPFDLLSLSEYIVNVTATDYSPSCLLSTLPCEKRTNSINIKIIVTTVNKHSPQFLNQICGKNISLKENNTAGENIAILVVFDEDRGDNGLISISFPSEQLRTTESGLSNTAYSQFYLEQLPQINGTDIRKAILKTNKTFDYDSLGATRIWYLYILATDNGKPPRQALCNLRINLYDINDNPPEFTIPYWNYTIFRSLTSLSTNFFRVIAFDADTGLNGLINYYIGTVNVPYFSINRATGTIILRRDISDITSLNKSYFPITFNVYAQDRGTPPLFSKNNATVTIYYNDNDEQPLATWIYPTCEELNITITEKFYEKYANRTVFDDNGFNGSIIYRLSSSESSLMIVKSPFLDNINMPFRAMPVLRNGQIFTSGILVTSGLHAEIQNVYSLYIHVLVNPPLIRSVIIRLKDENDQIPTFDLSSMTLSVIESEIGKRTIAQIQAYDRDVDYHNNHVEYCLNEKLTDNETIKYFYVESNGTIWTNRTFKENNKTLYRLFISAYNIVPAWNSASNNTQDFQFDIQVIKINDNIPVFINGSMINISIDETTKNGTVICNLTIMDLDIDTKLNLGIFSGNFRNKFTFTLLSDNSNNQTRTQYEAIGQLKVVATSDYKLKPNYTLVLFAFDAKNIGKINVIVIIKPENTKAPCFELMPGFTAYQYKVDENTEYSSLHGSFIRAIDPDNQRSNLSYEIYNTNHQLDLNNLYLNSSNNYVTIGIKSPGLSRDFPFGQSVYNFSIRATDENGTGISSYVPVSIEVLDINNKAPIPINFPWIIDEGNNSSIDIVFEDYDDPGKNNTTPFRVEIVNSSNFEIHPTQSYNGSYTLIYKGVLNRTLNKNLTVQFNTIDNKNFSKITTISIIVRDSCKMTTISDGLKTIKVVYIDGYQNSLRNIGLGSIYVNDVNDWCHADRNYSIINSNDKEIFYVSQGFLSTSELLEPKTYIINVNVTKSNVLTSAVSRIFLKVENVDSEYIRQASTIRIQGEYPETLIDPTLNYPLEKLINALASLLSTNNNSIIILSIRRVFQYQNPRYPPKPFDLDKNEALTDVIFYVPTLYKFQIERILNENFELFQSRFQIKVNASGPNPCNNYHCPIGTICRPTRTIHPKPLIIDTNLTSFVGINILDSADCINSINTDYLASKSNECIASIFTNSTSSLSTSIQSCGFFECCCCEILGRTFDVNGGGYAIYSSTIFSNFAPARFSFDFILQTQISDGLILLYGQDLSQIDDFSWIAVEIYQSKLRFHFRDTKFVFENISIHSSTWYHVECQFVNSRVLVSVNDCQYDLQLINDTLNTYNISTVNLYLGGLPPNTRIFGLYPSLKKVDTFNGCIRNVLSNGYYLNMSEDIESYHSNSSRCPCSVTNSCPSKKYIDTFIPWYTWLIITLVLLLFITIFSIISLIFIRKRQQIKALAELYTDDTRDNIIDYKENAGEKDHSTYNLRILKKPVYTLTDGNIIQNNDELDYNVSNNDHRPSLGDYITEKLDEQVLSNANDTRLHYLYEGDGSIASDLSSIQSSYSHDEIDYRYLYSLGPKFSRLADLYVSHANNDDI